MMVGGGGWRCLHHLNNISNPVHFDYVRRDIYWPFLGLAARLGTGCRIENTSSHLKFRSFYSMYGLGKLIFLYFLPGLCPGDGPGSGAGVCPALHWPGSGTTSQPGEVMIRSADGRSHICTNWGGGC